jgi:hypothetical protein
VTLPAWNGPGTVVYGDEIPYDAFLPEVLPYVPGCPEFVAINAIRNAAIAFCEKTNYVQMDSDPVTGVINVPTYEIDVPADTRFLDVMNAWYNNVLLIPKSDDELARIYRTLDWRTLSSNPIYITRLVEPIVQLVPFPNSTILGALTMRISLAPTRSSTGCQKRLWEHYIETIGCGARARLYATPGQPYGDPKMAAEYDLMFRRKCGDARRKVEKGLGRADAKIQFQGWV